MLWHIFRKKNHSSLSLHEAIFSEYDFPRQIPFSLQQCYVISSLILNECNYCHNDVISALWLLTPLITETVDISLVDPQPNSSLWSGTFAVREMGPLLNKHHKFPYHLTGQLNFESVGQLVIHIMRCEPSEVLCLKCFFSSWGISDVYLGGLKGTSKVYVLVIAYQPCKLMNNFSKWEVYIGRSYPIVKKTTWFYWYKYILFFKFICFTLQLFGIANKINLFRLLFFLRMLERPVVSIGVLCILQKRFGKGATPISEVFTHFKWIVRLFYWIFALIFVFMKDI